MKTTLNLLAAGTFLAATSGALATVRYVDGNSANPTPPYTSWATAAHVIQQAVDAAVAGDEIVVTNGTYATGGRAVVGTMTNRVAVDKPLRVRSVNGPQFTIIQGHQVPVITNGDGAIRCVYLTDDASLSGFTLTNGATLSTGNVIEGGGGGVWGGSTNAVVSNCLIVGNSAQYGGGAWSATLNNCALAGNSASLSGGGAYSCALNHCTLTDNSGLYAGGGAYFSTLNNCIVWFNTAEQWPNYDSYSSWNYCCTTPLPPTGEGNINVDPQLAGAWSLSVTSPCRGGGNPAYATGTDIDGEAWGTPPSIGCDEYHAGAATGPLSVGLVAAFTDVATRYLVDLTALIEGRTTASTWDFGDGIVVSNRPFATHAWAEPGDYLVVLRAFNDSQPQGVNATQVVHVVEAIHYVSARSTNPLAPFTSWTTAATNIQEAVDVATVRGALVLVTNGTYDTGGRAVYGTMTNRVAVDKPLMVRSVNGPEFTVIQGCRVPGTTNGDGAIRCVYLTNGASLSGFTLTNGATRTVSGDSYPSPATSGGGVWCQSVTAVVSNCVVAGNSAAVYGGGTSGGTLNYCALHGNSALMGGGAFNSTLNNCTLAGNSATEDGGGGAGFGTLNNCALTQNSAADEGGGALGSTLNNCTLTGNSAKYRGGASSCTLNNCIVYFNTDAMGEANYSSWDALNYCCTTPLPVTGEGNTSVDPQLGSAWRLSIASPCRRAGKAAYATGTDIDGEAWDIPPSIGCDEYYAGSATGPLSVGLVAAFTNVATGYPVDLTALIEGRTTASAWDFGDGVVVSNRPFATHAWAEPGDYTVVLRAFNDSQPAGASASFTVHVVAEPFRYVAASSANPEAPYNSWVTAARTIQEAVDAASVGGTILVSNGTYTTGGRAVYGTMTNRVAVDKPLTVRSVNGPQVTIIEGAKAPDGTNGEGAIRCAYLASGASLSGFTLTHGGTQLAEDYPTRRLSGGGGVWCESITSLVSNCVLIGNSAGSAGGAYLGTLSHCTLTGNSADDQGGGVAYSTLAHCTLSSNSVTYQGGGAWYSTLNNCTLTGNSAWVGGGADSSTLNNCIVYFNTAVNGANDWYGNLNYSCTTPIPAEGVGNISNEPLFLDYVGGNLRLQSNSPCINAGNNAYLTSTTDLDGNPRIVSGMVDIGAYEYQGTGSVISYAWLQQYGLPTDSSADFTDPDRDGMNNWQEWRCGTCPTNALSALRLLSAAPIGTNVTVIWQSVAGAGYFLERSANLASPFMLLATNIVGQAGTTGYADTNATGAGPFFYRVGVGN